MDELPSSLLDILGTNGESGKEIDYCASKEDSQSNMQQDSYRDILNERNDAAADDPISILPLLRLSNQRKDAINQEQVDYLQWLEESRLEQSEFPPTALPKHQTNGEFCFTENLSEVSSRSEPVELTSRSMLANQLVQNQRQPIHLVPANEKQHLKLTISSRSIQDSEECNIYGQTDVESPMQSSNIYRRQSEEADPKPEAPAIFDLNFDSENISPIVNKRPLGVPAAGGKGFVPGHCQPGSRLANSELRLAPQRVENPISAPSFLLLAEQSSVTSKIDKILCQSPMLRDSRSIKQREQMLKQEDDVVLSIDQVLSKKPELHQPKTSLAEVPPLVLPSKTDYITSVDRLLLDSLSSVDRPHRCSKQPQPKKSSPQPLARLQDAKTRQSPPKPTAAPTSPQSHKDRPLIADLISHFSETLKCLKKKKEVQVISTQDPDFLRHSSPAKSLLTVDRSRSPFSTRSKLLTIEPRDSCGPKLPGRLDCSPQKKPVPLLASVCLDHRICTIKAAVDSRQSAGFVKSSYHLGKSNVTTSTGTLKNIPSKSHHADCSVSKTPSESAEGRPAELPLPSADSPTKKKTSKYWKAESLKNLPAQSKHFCITPKMKHILTSADVSQVASRYLQDKSPPRPAQLQPSGPDLSLRGALDTAQTCSRGSLENSLSFAPR